MNKYTFVGTLIGAIGGFTYMLDDPKYFWGFISICIGSSVGYRIGRNCDPDDLGKPVEPKNETPRYVEIV